DASLVREGAAQPARRLQKLGLPCPKPLLLRGHVLAMSFIGESGCAAPRLKDCRLETIQWRSAPGDQAAGYLHRLYNECRLVHADYSEYNLLWWRNTVWIIDVSQAVDHEHPRALDFLLRDCRTACSFFSRKGVPDVPEPEQLFNSITGLDEYPAKVTNSSSGWPITWPAGRISKAIESTWSTNIQSGSSSSIISLLIGTRPDAADEAENEDDEEEEAEALFNVHRLWPNSRRFSAQPLNVHPALAKPPVASSRQANLNPLHALHNHGSARRRQGTIAERIVRDFPIKSLASGDLLRLHHMAIKSRLRMNDHWRAVNPTAKTTKSPCGTGPGLSHYQRLDLNPC
uniref:non-specific serine/threonine protein kinase n=1 Tax=Macrostomum lignano TaxID=282301 RepID=A0A1I8FPF4_9PLAT